MAREIFVDASFWTALFYSPDEHHNEAQTVWREVVIQQWLTVTANWTLYETLTYLNSRRRHDLAVEVLDFMADSTEIVHIEEAELEDRSLEIFRRHSDKHWSVVDCANFVCIEHRQCEFALAYDRNFEQAQLEFSFQLFKP